jgi:hypothetical protein
MMKRFTCYVAALIFCASLLFVPNLAEAKPHKTVQSEYQVTGQVRAWEASYSFRIKAGKKELVEGYGTATQGAPEWGDFKELIKVKHKKGQKLTLELFEISQADGSEIHKLTIPLDKIEGKVFHNETFRNVKVSLN